MSAVERRELPIATAVEFSGAVEQTTHADLLRAAATWVEEVGATPISANWAWHQDVDKWALTLTVEDRDDLRQEVTS